MKNEESRLEMSDSKMEKMKRNGPEISIVVQKQRVTRWHRHHRADSSRHGRH